jgi:hypothetical protein
VPTVSCQLCCSTMFRGGGSRHAFEPLQFPSKPLRPRRSQLEYHLSEYRAKSLVKSFARRSRLIGDLNTPIAQLLSVGNFSPGALD